MKRIKQPFAMIRLPLFRPVQWFWKTTGQDGNIAAHLSLLCAAGIWGEVLLLNGMLLKQNPKSSLLKKTFLHYREVAEWSKALAWNAGMGQLIEGSNPFLSAIEKSTPINPLK